MADINEDGYTWRNWKKNANDYSLALSGVTLDDLPDTNMYDAWLNNCPPEEFVDEVLLEEGFPFPPGHRYYSPPRPRTTPEYYTETITLENGKTVTVERKHSASGYVRVIL